MDMGQLITWHIQIKVKHAVYLIDRLRVLMYALRWTTCFNVYRIVRDAH